jgi:hypothetical protein
MTYTRIATATSALALILLLTLSATALAHEHREVGDLELIVGWAVEPAFVGEKNGLDLRITKPLAAMAAATTTEHADDPAAAQTHEEASPRAPVEGAETTLTAEVTFGGNTKGVPLRAVYGEPGAYTADILPTEAGDYRFHIAGTVDGQAIDETFDSVEGDFSGVAASTDIQFPAPALAPAEAASAVSSTVSAAEQTAASNQLLAYLGIGIGLAALVVALAALARGRG